MKDRDHLIVGVVGDLKNSSLQGATEPALYHSLRQFAFRHVYVVARGTDQTRLADAIRSTVRRADGSIPVPELRTMASVIGESFERPQFLMFLMWVFAVSAVSLAALGIYGLLTYTVTERQQELSIRLALGARPAGVLLMVLRQGAGLAAAGTIAGVAIAYAAARNIGSLLYGVSPGDPIALGAGAAVAITVAMAACALPACRASRLNPLGGLKE
jgi:putative ABC transport system permease protein